MSGLFNLAKIALSTAQKRIDQVLDIHFEEESSDDNGRPAVASESPGAVQRETAAEHFDDQATAVQLCLEALIWRVSLEVDQPPCVSACQEHLARLPNRYASYAEGRNSGCTSPAEEAETTVSSDIELICNSLDDNGSDRSGDARAVSLCDSNGRHALNVLLQRRLLHQAAGKNESSAADVISHYEKKVIELGERLAAEQGRADQLWQERQQLAKENEHLKRVAACLKEKDEKIADLLFEGERLSKKELQQSNLIKKLREREKELTKAVEQLRQDTRDVGRLKAELREMNGRCEEQENACRRLSGSLKQAESTIAKANGQLENNAVKLKEYQAQVESLKREIAELTAAKSTALHQLQKLKEWKNQNAEEALRDHYESKESEWRTEKLAICKQVDAANAMIRQIQDEYASKEASLKSELRQLRQKLEAVEMRNQDLAENAANVSKPLLVQIASMQTAQQVQQQRWEETERMLLVKMKQTEEKCKEAEQKAAQADKQYLDATKAHEKSLCKYDAVRDELKDVKEKLTSAEAELARRTQAEHRMTEKLEEQRLYYERQLSNSKGDQAISERSVVACEHQDQTAVVENLKADLEEKVKKIMSLQLELAEERRQNSKRLAEADDEAEPSVSDPWSEIGMGEARAAAMPENLYDRLQHYENEMRLLKEELIQMQASRNQLAEDLTSLNQELSCTKQEFDECRGVKEEYTDLQAKHQALLEMYGEISEDNDALTAELRHVKRIFQTQIEELIAKQNVN